MSCGADKVGLELLSELIAGKDFSLPDVDFDDEKWGLPDSLVQALKDPAATISLEDLTTTKVGGEGAFDVMMTALRNHLKDEYQAGRITGAEYSKTYVALTSAALQTSLQFLLQKDQAKWSAITAQIQAQAAQVGLETAKAQYIMQKASALTAEAQYGLTVMKIASEDVTYCNLQEQHESLRAQTLDTRTDGTLVKGSVGKQKDLYSQQITSYQRSAESNGMQILKDAWIAHKSIDEGIDTPASFNATTISNAIQKYLGNLNLR